MGKPIIVQVISNCAPIYAALAVVTASFAGVA
jgi:hypothetical protein